MEALMSALSAIFGSWSVLLCFVGVFVGIIFGFLPGLSATMGVALLMPFTFTMEPTPAMALLLGIYCGGIYGGSITAILIRTPGTPASAATVMDGYPMTEQGRAKEALQSATLGSTIGGLFSCVILVIASQAIAKFALKFGSAEYFAVSLFGLSMVTSLSAKDKIKGIMGVIIGYLFSTIGLDKISGLPRYTMGNLYMMAGIETVTALVGLFAISEIINKVSKSTVKEELGTVAEYAGKGMKITTLLSKHLVNIVRSSVIGTVIGIIPATGGGTASWLAYNEAKRFDKEDTFGKGNVDGVIASETANNAVTGGALVPLLALGVPGDTVTAVLLGALMIQGLAPGPQLFVDHADVITAIYVLMIISNIFMCFFGLVGVKLFVKVLNVPPEALTAVVTALCCVGAYAVRNYTFDVKCAVFMGIAGFIFTKVGIPIPPILLGLLLGQNVETNFRKTMTQFDGNWTVFFTKPISCVLLVVCIVAFFFPIIRDMIDSKKKK